MVRKIIDNVYSRGKSAVTSMVETPRKTKGKPSHQLPDNNRDKEEIYEKGNEQLSPIWKNVSAGTNLESDWVKKSHIP